MLGLLDRPYTQLATVFLLAGEMYCNDAAEEVERYRATVLATPEDELWEG
jgi:hypothetical protein